MLNVIYRPFSGETEDHTYDRPGHRPEWFSKYNTHKSLFNSIVRNKEYVKKVYVLFDGVEGIFYNQILESLKSFTELQIPYEVQNIHAGSVYNSVKISTEFACNVGGNIYIVEDDYFHLPDAIKKIALALPKYKLLSGYDHPDRYYRVDDINYNLQVSFDRESDHHWRTSESTGHTYAVSGDLLEKIKPVLNHHDFIRSDRDLWRFLHTQNIPLWTSVPGFVTQVDPYLSPGVDWKKYSEECKQY
jgi:hypothetical protein